MNGQSGPILHMNGQSGPILHMNGKSGPILHMNGKGSHCQVESYILKYLSQLYLWLWDN